jgi:hypothetical protein
MPLSLARQEESGMLLATNGDSAAERIEGPQRFSRGGMFSTTALSLPASFSPLGGLAQGGT